MLSGQECVGQNYCVHGSVAIFRSEQAVFTAPITARLLACTTASHRIAWYLCEPSCATVSYFALFLISLYIRCLALKEYSVPQAVMLAASARHPTEGHCRRV